MRNFFLLGCLLVAGSLWARSSTYGDFHSKLSHGFESEYVYRGFNLYHHVALTSFEVSHKVKGGDLYVGLLNSYIMQATHDPIIEAKFGLNKADFSGGYRWAPWKQWEADAGFTYHWYTTKGLWNIHVDYSREFYAGLRRTSNAWNPSAYFYYDIDFEQITAELAIKRVFSLQKWLPNTSLSTNFFWGGVACNNTDANSTFSGWTNRPHDGYAYYGNMTDLIYTISDKANVSLGVRCVGNNDNLDNLYLDAFMARNVSFWWGARFNMSL